MSNRVIVCVLIELEMSGGRHTKGTSTMKYKKNYDGGAAHGRIPETEFPAFSETWG